VVVNCAPLGHFLPNLAARRALSHGGHFCFDHENVSQQANVAGSAMRCAFQSVARWHPGDTSKHSNCSALIRPLKSFHFRGHS
jgi:hypothetical protein